MAIDDLTAQTYGLSDHQRNFFSTLLSFYDIRGKDVLEVGGAMPSGLVLDTLGVNSWTCVQSQEYAAHRNDNQTPSANLGNGRYSAIYANIEDVGGSADFSQRYDTVFSIACFEHIHKFPQALNVMYQALRPGGCLYSTFAPIWSGPWGQHLTEPVPSRFDAMAPAAGWTQQDYIGPWDHLLLSRFQFYERIKQRFDASYAEALSYMTYNSPQINRYFFEDYENFVKESKFSKTIFRGLFEVESNEYVSATLKELRQRFAGSGYQNFSNSGIMVFLGK